MILLSVGQISSARLDQPFARLPMLTISATQVESLGEGMRRAYIEGVAQTLLEEDCRPCVEIVFPGGLQKEQALGFAEETVCRGGRLGFHLEAELNAFVLLDLMMRSGHFDDGSSAWLKACLAVTQHPASSRMDAIYGFVPAEYRDFIFR